MDPADTVSSPGTYKFCLGSSDVEFRFSTASGKAQIAPTRVRSVLVRRPSRPQPRSGEQTEQSDAFFLGESVAVLDAVPYLCDPDTLWVNHPHVNRLAGLKLRQLARAQEAGLHVPPTLVTNIPAEAYEFYKRHGERLICKPLSSTPITQDGSWFIFTHELRAAMASSDFDDVAMGSSLLQVCIEKRSDVRVAVIGDTVIGCEILSQGDVRATTDWRVVPVGLEHRIIAVPDAVAQALRSLRATLGLAAMHCDFAIARDTGQWWFLEANPNGQWLWIELATGAAIADAFAGLLARGRA